jgi:hypothetical protein
LLVCVSNDTKVSDRAKTAISSTRREHVMCLKDLKLTLITALGLVSPV